MARLKKRSGRTRRADRALVPAVMHLLVNGGPTVFCHEGAVHHGLRAGFCLQGGKWHTSDLRAGRIVAEALSLLGAVRPSYAEGQRDWCVTQVQGERWTCLRCGGEIPPERAYWNARFCSDHCINRRYEEGARKAHAQLSRIEYLATMTALRERKREAFGHECETCGKKFLTKEATKNGSRSERFCSHACRQAVLTPRPCAVCGTVFTPKRHPEAETCGSDACLSARRRERIRAERFAMVAASEAPPARPRGPVVSQFLATYENHN